MMAIVRQAESRNELRWSAISSDQYDPEDIINRGGAEWDVVLPSYTYVYRFIYTFGGGESIQLDLQALSFTFMNNANTISISSLRYVQAIVDSQDDGQPIPDGPVLFGNSAPSPHLDLFGGRTGAAFAVHAGGTLAMSNPTAGGWDSSAGVSGIHLANTATVPQTVTFYAAGD